MLSAADKKRLISLRLKKYRDKYKSFLIEGPHLVSECLCSPYIINNIYIKEDAAYPELSDIIEKAKAKDIEIIYLSENDIKKFCLTETPQGILAEVNYAENKSSLNYDSDMIAALDRINDPGNLGTIIRTCYWFGVKQVLISEESADIYNPKVLRSSQGAVFHSELFNNINLDLEINTLKEKGFNVYISDLNTNDLLSDIKFGKNNVIVFGNEAAGVSNTIKQKYQSIKIPSYSNCESLNVAVSSGIFLYEFRNNIKPH